MSDCECGCDGQAAEGKRFIRGHQLRVKENRVRLNCSSCCRPCGQHFTGTAAFDAHLRRVNHRRNRFGVADFDIEHLTGEAAELELAVQDGGCTVGPVDLAGVMVWRLPLGAAGVIEEVEDPS